MNNILNKLFGGMLLKLNLWELLFMIYRLGGRDAVQRFFTMPDKVARRVPSVLKDSTNLPVVKEEAAEATEEIMELMDSCLDEDFEDPDDETTDNED